MFQSIRSRLAVAAALGAGLSLFTAVRTTAQSVLLPIGATVYVPESSLALEPSTAGEPLHGIAVPFVMRDRRRQVVCSGQIRSQLRRSVALGTVDIIYIIGVTGGYGRIEQVDIWNFAHPVRVAYITPTSVPGSAHTLPPYQARRNRAGDVTFLWNSAVWWQQLSCGSGDFSAAFIIRTQSTSDVWLTDYAKIVASFTIYNGWSQTRYFTAQTTTVKPGTPAP